MKPFSKTKKGKKFIEATLDAPPPKYVRNDSEADLRYAMKKSLDYGYSEGRKRKMRNVS